MIVVIRCDSEIYKYAMYVFRLQFVAKKLDRRLLDLGATPIVERGLGDDQHPSGYYSTVRKVIRGILVIF